MIVVTASRRHVATPRVSDAEIAEMRRRRHENLETVAALAAEYGLSASYTSHVLLGRLRASAGGPTGPVGRSKRITDAQVMAMRERRAATGDSYAVIAAEYGVSESYATAICNGRHRGDAGGPIQAPVSRDRSPRFDPAPFRERVNRTGATPTSVAAALGVHSTSVHRWLTSGVPLKRVDDVAEWISGDHPAAIWPDYVNVCVGLFPTELEE